MEGWDTQQEANIRMFRSKVVVCYLFGQEGHIKSACPKANVKLTKMCYVPGMRDTSHVNCEPQMKMTSVEVNGQRLRALIDTGSTQTLIHRQYVPSHFVCTGETVPVC